MSVIEWKKVETVGVITMNNGENRHNPKFIRAILTSFDEIETMEKEDPAFIEPLQLMIQG